MPSSRLVLLAANQAQAAMKRAKTVTKLGHKHLITTVIMGIYLFIAYMIAATPRSLAGTGAQGTDVQGTDIQGTVIQGRHLQHHREPRPTHEARGLEGQRLIAIKHGALPSHLAVLEVLRAAGESVHALRWSAATGWRELMLHPRELVGYEWLEYHCGAPGECSLTTYRITHVEQDISRNTMPEYRDNGDIWLYRVEYTDAATPNAGAWQPVCSSEDGAPVLGMFLAGRWRSDGSWDERGYTFSCTTGVLAKCARNWGYKPWRQLFAQSGQAIGLQPLHQACVRAARADYCGTGAPHTQDGTMIDMFDIYGFNVRSHDTTFAEEAGFTPQGARWVVRTRWAMIDRGDREPGPWSTFADCRRPKQATLGEGDPVLIHVWSSRDNLIAAGAPHPRTPGIPRTAGVESTRRPRD